MEIPANEFEGDFARTKLEDVGEGAARIIGVEDLYVDRLLRTTARQNVEGIEYKSALAVGLTCFDIIGWSYVRKRIAAEAEYLRDPMTRTNARIRRRVRRELGR